MSEFIVYADHNDKGEELPRRKYFTGMVERWPEVLSDRARAVRFQAQSDAIAAAQRLKGYIFAVEAA